MSGLTEAAAKLKQVERRIRRVDGLVYSMDRYLDELNKQLDENKAYRDKKEDELIALLGQRNELRKEVGNGNQGTQGQDS